MIKQKLHDKRVERGYTQDEFAFKLEQDTSNYNRRENGVTKISKKEWDKMAKILDTTLDEIYEPEDGVYVINGDNAHGNFGNGGTFNNNSDFIFDTLKKYIQKLEEENKGLIEKDNVSKQLIQKLEEEIVALKKRLGDS